MDISMLSGVTSDYLNTYAKQEGLLPADDDSFSTVLDAAMKSLEETNNLKKTAESEEMRFMLGDVENTHDLLIAEVKSVTALQYTNAVKNKLIEGYKELMQMQV